MAEEKDIALIESYLQDELEGEARLALEERLQQDESFKSLFEDTQVLTEGLSKLRRKALLAKMDKMEEGLADPLAAKAETKTIFWTFQRVAAAMAGLAIVALASWFVFTGNGSPDGSALFEEYYVTYDNTLVPTTRGDEAVLLINRAFQAYDQANYERAVVLMDELMQEDDRIFIRLYAGLAHMELGANGKAEELFNAVIQGEGDFKTQATWFQALNFLKIQEYDKSISLLEELAGSETTYQSKAKELLKKMR